MRARLEVTNMPGSLLTATELVMSDLVDVLIQENLFGFADGSREGEWYCVGRLRLRVRDGGVFQDLRFAGGPVLDGDRELTPDELLLTIACDEPRVKELARDLRTAIEHARITLDNRHDLSLANQLAGERLAATRNRPFHPTARATVGWTGDELTRYGPMRSTPVGLDWIAVHRRALKFGGGAESDRFSELLLDHAEREGLGQLHDDFRLVPVHPWQFEHVLRRKFAAELNAGIVRLVARDVGRFHPTASLRTLASTDPTLHVKLPLAVATLGVRRLLPPDSLGNAECAEHMMRALLRRDPVLAKRVVLCEEQAWCGWGGDEADTRSGHLSALLRRYPAEVANAIPMAAFAANEWDTIQPFISTDPVTFFGELAGAFSEMALAFLRYGVLPELHGQNVLVTLRDGVPDRFVLRDHDTVRLYPPWMDKAHVPEPLYRFQPNVSQSLRLVSADELIAYLQVLGFQMNLHGIADALARHYGIAEHVLWQRVRDGILTCVNQLDLPGQVERALLHAPMWPSRPVLGWLLRHEWSSGVPGFTVCVRNPLVPSVSPGQAPGLVTSFH
jgi:siderophore synthetase component